MKGKPKTYCTIDEGRMMLIKLIERWLSSIKHIPHDVILGWHREDLAISYRRSLFCVVVSECEIELPHDKIRKNISDPKFFQYLEEQIAKIICIGY